MTTTVSPLSEVTGLEGSAYSSPELFDRELRDFFHTTWQYAGHVSEFSQPGSFKRFTLGRADVLVIAGSDGELRALHNTCRHRGAQLIAEQAGVCKRVISCSYHGWAYETTGALRGAPKMGDAIDPSALGLRTAGLEVWEGIVFVNVDGHTPPPVRESLGDVEWPCTDLARSKVAKVLHYDLNCNWKASWENALECYHCAINHPELIGLLDRDGKGRAFAGGVDYSFSDNPLKVGNQSVTMSGQVESAVTYDLTVATDDSRRFLQWHRTAFEMILSPDHVALMTYQPLAPELTRVTQTFLVPQDAVPGVDYNPDSLFDMHILAREQDNGLCEKIQSGVRNPAYLPGPFNDVYEQENRRFVSTYRDVMGLR